MTIQSARGPPGRAEEPGASLKTGLVEWRLARARASTPFGERSLCYQSRFADANSAAPENAHCHSLNAVGVLAFCAFAVCSTVWGMGYRTHGLQNSRVFAGEKREKRDVHEPVSKRNHPHCAVPGPRRGDRGTGVCMSHIPNFRLPASTRYESM